MTIAIISMIREPWGGSEELWAAMAQEALKKGHTVIHLSYRCSPLHPKMKALADKGLVMYTRPSFKPVNNNSMLRAIERGLFFLQKRMNRSISKICGQKPDVILYNGTCYSITDEKQLLKYIFKTSPVFFLLGHFNREDGKDLEDGNIELVKKAYQNSKRVLFITERSVHNARKRLAADIPNALVVRNPVNIISTEAIKLPSNKTVQFAMVGNLLIVHKGQDIALQSLSSETWKQRNWHLNIYGSGEDESHLRKLVDFLGLTGRVSFHGRVNNIRKVWETNHVLLMPSHMEGMPLAVVEAMLCGRPAVVTDVGGNREWIEEGLQGFIAEAPTVSSFGAAMERAWAEKDNWAQIGQQAHDKAMKLYDPEAGKTLLRILTGG